MLNVRPHLRHARPVSAVQPYAKLSEQRNQKILQRKLIVHLDPTHSSARVIGCGQNGSDATALFERIDFPAPGTKSIQPQTGSLRNRATRINSPWRPVAKNALRAESN